jgi:hypothetical protein
MAERTVPEIELKYKPTGKRGQWWSGSRAQTSAYDFNLQWKQVFLF